MDARTDPARERQVAELLGADPATAAAAVAAVEAAGALAVGVALPALLLAARRGTDARGALGLLAAGEPVPTSWSSFEQRTAQAEAAQEVRARAGGVPIALPPPAPDRAVPVADDYVDITLRSG